MHVFVIMQLKEHYTENRILCSWYKVYENHRIPEEVDYEYIDEIQNFLEENFCDVFCLHTFKILWNKEVLFDSRNFVETYNY